MTKAKQSFGMPVNIADGMVNDGLQNIVANIGTDRDKVAHSEYVHSPLDFMSCLNAYEASGLVRKIIDAPAEDAGREWRAWDAKPKQITAIEEEEARLLVKQKVMEAEAAARLFGGAGIYIQVQGEDPATPLDPERINKNHKVSELHLISMLHLREGPLQDDPILPGFGWPAYFEIPRTQGNVARLHPSRLVIFQGHRAPVGIFSYSQYRVWGSSALNGILTDVKRLDTGMAGVANLILEAKVDVLYIEGFMEDLQSGEEYDDVILRRLALNARAKGINGMMLLDNREKYEQKSAAFSAVPETLDRLMQMVSAVSRIPMTRLFGIAPAGMNATGEGDMNNYHEWIHNRQSNGWQPRFTILDECIIRGALGRRPDEIFYTWRPLKKQTEKEIAESAEIKARTVETIKGTGLVSNEALAITLVNALVENGAFPGLEQANEEKPVDFAKLEELDKAKIVKPEPTGQPGAANKPGAPRGNGNARNRPVRRNGTTDAAPRSLYIQRKVVNAADVIAHYKKQGVPNITAKDELHVTVLYSKAPLDWFEVGEAWNEEIRIPAGGARLTDQFGDATVLLFASTSLKWRHEDLVAMGASHDFPDYQPHITISYQIDGLDLSTIEPYQGEIVLGPELFAEVVD